MRCRIISDALAIGFPVPPPPGIVPPAERRAEADHLLPFLLYVNWPETAFPAAGAPLVHAGTRAQDPREKRIRPKRSHPCGIAIWQSAGN
jgi:hypothetical protein